MSNTAPTTPSTGSLQIVEDESTFAADRSSGIIVVESTLDKVGEFPQAIDELQSAAARNLALGYAATRGMSDPYVNGNVDGPFAVNHDLVQISDVQEKNASSPLPPSSPELQPYRYRAAVPVCRRMR